MKKSNIVGRVPGEAIRKVYAPFRPPRDAVGEMRGLIGTSASRRLGYPSSHACRM